MLPNFIIAGATRSGTTSLYYYLNQHPEISFPSLKEPRYFSSIQLKLPQNGPGDHTVDEKLIRSLDDYKALYDKINNKFVGDASSEYLYHYEYSADEIKKALGDIPILIILRNPIDRAYSAFSNHVRDGREKLSFIDAIYAEEERKANNWDMMWAYKSVGLYAKQVKKYKSTFTNVKIVIFEEFTKTPNLYLKEIFRFLGVDENIEIETDTKYSHSGKPKNRIIGWVTSRNSPVFYPLRKSLLSIIPRKHFEHIASKLFQKDDIPANVRNELKSFFKQDINELEALLKINLNHWKS